MRCDLLAVLTLTCLVLTATSAGAFDDTPLENPDSQDFHRPAHYRRSSISPTGRFVASYLVEDEDHYIAILDTRSLKREFLSVEVNQKGEQLRNMGWLDPDSVIVEMRRFKNTPNAESRIDGITVIDVVANASTLELETHRVGFRGRVVDSLRDAEDHFLVAVANEDGSVFRLNPRDFLLSEEETRIFARRRAIDTPPQATSETEVARLPGRVSSWYTTPQGKVLGGYATENGKRKLWHRATEDEKWREIFRSDIRDEVDIKPVGLTRGGSNLVVLSVQGRDTWALYEYDPKNRKLGDLIFERPSQDVTGVLYAGNSSEVVGAITYQAGLPRHHYFETVSDTTSWLRKRFAGKTVAILSESQDRKKVIALVHAPNDPGSYYHLDLENRRLLQYGQRMPWLDPKLLAPVSAFKVQAEGGPIVEAFIAIPPDAEKKPPLVVVPHGGPIGVADDRHFDVVVQQLADRGYAVLKVNYRGSGGHGIKFMKDGLEEWGTGIEDDIDAAINYVVDAEMVDPDRMCIVGSSYGGYSALVSVIRWPKRFRCAATVMGATDIALMFSTADFSHDQRVRESYKDIVGDPKKKYKRMKGLSPVYNVQSIEIPIFVAHGDKDRRVDIEHSSRLMAMFDLYDISYEWMLMRGGGHGFTTQSYASYHSRLLSFLDEHIHGPLFGELSEEELQEFMSPKDCETRTGKYELCSKGTRSLEE